MTPPIFSAPLPFNTPTMFSLNQPPPPLPAGMFDASRPPPPLPTNATPTKNGAIKRAAGPYEAGPGKARKAECSK
ncbi:hypothetical protein PYW07_014281 [Mythimna separata]|nr:hypothetical protein PYW07_014281 [Mythimna separata]